MESLHEPGVAIDAAMGATGVTIERIIAEYTVIQDRLAHRLANDRFAGRLTDIFAGLAVFQHGSRFSLTESLSLYPIDTGATNNVAWGRTVISD
jgi:hypothetical protein